MKEKVNKIKKMCTYPKKPATKQCPRMCEIVGTLASLESLPLISNWSYENVVKPLQLAYHIQGVVESSS